MSKFKVGDHVQVRDVEVGTEVGHVSFVDSMRCLCGLEGVVREVRESDGLVAWIDFNDASLDGCWLFANEWLELVDSGTSSEPEPEPEPESEPEPAVAIDCLYRGFGVYDGDVPLSDLKAELFGASVWCPLFGVGVVRSVDSTDLDLCVLVSWVGASKTAWFTSRGQLGSSLETSPCILWPSEHLLSWRGWQASDRWRASAGETYFYIDSEMNLVRVTDTGDLIHTTRWLVRNYFKTADEGYKVLGRVAQVLYDSVVK